MTCSFAFTNQRVTELRRHVTEAGNNGARLAAGNARTVAGGLIA